MAAEKWFVTGKRADFQAIGEKYNIDPVTARIIRNRDITDDADIAKYLHPNLSALYSPHLMKDMDRLVEILQEKICSGKKIRIIGDYDIDGVQSAYILLQGIRRAGGIVTASIPDRMKDGYGINENLVLQAKEDGADTILTCDNGIAALGAIACAKELGMTVLVTECGYQFSGICGAVVAFKVIQALYEKCGIPAKEAMEFLENAAFATVGDVMDLTDENRIIVKFGLERMRGTKNPGLRALIRQKEVLPEGLSAYHL